MKKQITQAIKRLWEIIKFYLWYKPISKPPKQQPLRTMAIDVAKDYMIITYCGQRINMLKIAYPIWKMSSREDKRATMLEFKKQEAKGSIKFVEVEGHTICIANRDYDARARKAEEAKHGN